MLAAIRLVTEPFQFEYMQRALVAALVISVLGGVVGVVVQLRDLSFMTDALTHTVFPGIAIAFVLDQSLFIGALVAAGLSAVLLTFAGRSAPGSAHGFAARGIDHDAFTALVLAGLFSIGVLVVSRTRTYSSDLTALLFGRVLAVDATQIVQMLAVALVALGVLVAIRKELLLRTFDPQNAEAMGYSLVRIDLAVNVVVALVVVAAVRAVGTALVVAFLITPAATARLLGRRLGSLVAVSVGVGIVASWLGLAISYDASIHHDVNLAAGATIVVVLTAMFTVAAAATALRTRRRHRRALRTRPAAAESHDCEVAA